MYSPGDESPRSSTIGPSQSQRLAEIAFLFLRLGFTAFGGPAAHVAMMQDEVVVRRRWIDRQQFLDAYSALNFIPGPNSTELAIHLGYVRAGFAGLITAGICFIVPAVLIILPIAWAYVQFGQRPQAVGMMLGVNAAVVAIVLSACVQFAQTAIADRFTASVALAALLAEVGLLAFPWVQPDLIVLALAAMMGMIRAGKQPVPAAAGMLPLLAAPAQAAAGATSAGGLWQLAGVFLKIGATLFGSGYVLVSYLQSSVVDQYRWLTRPELLNAVSVGQFTPGPLLTTATFIGYLRGWQIFHNHGGAVVAAVIATTAIFAPSFVLVALVGPLLPKLRKSPWAKAALDAVNAAVVALIAVATFRLGAAALVFADRRELIVVPVFLISVTAILRYKVNATWMIVLGAAAGWMTSFLHIR